MQNMVRVVAYVAEQTLICSRSFSHIVEALICR